MGGGISSRLNDAQNPIAAILTNHSKENVDFIPHSMQRAGFKRIHVIDSDFKKSQGVLFSYAKLGTTISVSQSQKPLQAIIVEDFEQA